MADKIEMPEKIWADDRTLGHVWPASPEPWGVTTATEYIRADLVETWKDLPDSPGLWVNEENGPVVFDFGYRASGEEDLGYFSANNEWVSVNSLDVKRWYGPLREDK